MSWAAVKQDQVKEAVSMEPEPAFEVALKQLETIVDDLERGEPELSAALTKYEEGVRLLARCHVVLDRAEQSVALLTGVDGSGNPVVTPFLGEGSVENSVVPAPSPTPKTRKRSTPPPSDPNDTTSEKG